MATLLVADQDDQEEAGNLAIISVEKGTGKINGIVQRAGQQVKFTQRNGKNVSSSRRIYALYNSLLLFTLY